MWCVSSWWTVRLPIQFVEISMTNIFRACLAAIIRIYVIQKIFTEDVGCKTLHFFKRFFELTQLALLNDDAAPKLVLCAALELNIGLISACLPTLRNSLQKASRIFHKSSPNGSDQTPRTPRLSLSTITELTRMRSLEQQSTHPAPGHDLARVPTLAQVV